MSTAGAAQTEKLGATVSASSNSNDYPFYAFRIWYGMVAGAWMRVIAANRFAVSPERLPFVLIGAVCLILGSLLNVIQTLIFAKRIRASVLDQPPIFIVGHWRTGTTHLHELLTLDESFTAPSTLECFAPASSLVAGWLLRILRFLLPDKRPMDNMPVGWDHPQEDEFALLNLGLGSPYEAILFPNLRRVHHEFLNMSDVTPVRLEAWKAGLIGFLQQVNFRSNRDTKRSNATRRIVLKSPTHTARLRLLRQMFPGAKFIHIVRDPFEVFSSTVRLWRGLYETQGCQEPDFASLPDGGPGIEQYVFDTMDLLYRDFFTEVAQIPRQDFCQVRYEDLVRQPIAEVRRLYRHLKLGSFDAMQPKLEAHLHGIAGYQKNEHRLSDEHRAEVNRRWRWYMEEFGYRAPGPVQKSWPGVRPRIAA